ncbi:MAG: hypothetical protein Q9187_003254 [Circinaria calcarea]
MILPRDSSSTTNLVPVIAAVVGGIVAVVIIATVVYFIRKDRRSTKDREARRELRRQQRLEEQYQQRGLGATTYRIDEDTELTLTSPLSKEISPPLFSPPPPIFNLHYSRNPYIPPTSPVDEATIRHLASVSANTADPVAVPALYRQAQLMHDVNTGTDNTSATDASAAGPVANSPFLQWKARKYEQLIADGKTPEEAMLGSDASASETVDVIDERVGAYAYGAYGRRGAGAGEGQRVVPAPLRVTRKGSVPDRWR